MTYPYTSVNPMIFNSTHPADMSAHLVEDFAERVLHAPQQKKSLTWDMHPFGRISGEYLSFETSEAEELTEDTGKYGTTTYSEHDEGRREIHMKRFNKAHLIDPDDREGMLVDPQSIVLQKLQWAAERTRDNQFHAAVFGDVLTQHARTGTESWTEANGAKIIQVNNLNDLLGAFEQARTYLDESEFLDVNEMSYAHMPPSILNKFIISEDRVISRDYVEGRPIQTGNMNAVFDFQLLKSNRITSTSDNKYWRCPLVMESSMIKGYRTLVRINIGPDPNRNWNEAVHYQTAFGWMRTHIKAVVELQIAKTATLSGISATTNKK